MATIRSSLRQANRLIADAASTYDKKSQRTKDYLTGHLFRLRADKLRIALGEIEEVLQRG